MRNEKLKLLPVGIIFQRVGAYQIDIVQKVLGAIIFVHVYLRHHSLEVHRLFDNVQIIRHLTMSNIIFILPLALNFSIGVYSFRNNIRCAV